MEIMIGFLALGAVCAAGTYLVRKQKALAAIPVKRTSSLAARNPSYAKLFGKAPRRK